VYTFRRIVAFVQAETQNKLGETGREIMGSTVYQLHQFQQQLPIRTRKALKKLSVQRTMLERVKSVTDNASEFFSSSIFRERISNSFGTSSSPSLSTGSFIEMGVLFRCCRELRVGSLAGTCGFRALIISRYLYSVSR
jgi:hypothetical protein